MTASRWADLLMLMRTSAWAPPAVAHEPTRPATASQKIKARQRIRTPGPQLLAASMVNVPHHGVACQRRIKATAKGAPGEHFRAGRLRLKAQAMLRPSILALALIVAGCATAA